MGGGPEYFVDRKLGKGGFGQVFIGRRVNATKQRDGANANLVRTCPAEVHRGNQALADQSWLVAGGSQV